MEGIAELVASAHRKGAKLWTQDGRLHYRAPPGLLTPQELSRFRELRDEIVVFLEQGGAAAHAEVVLRPRAGSGPAPLTFSQQVHWSCIGAGERRPMRHFCSATRLSGDLNVGALREAVAECIRRHEALRTHVVVRDGVPVQDIAPFSHEGLETIDLSHLPAGVVDRETNRWILKAVTDVRDLARDPLFAIYLVKVRSDEHVLIVAMEHMICDAFSMGLLLRDLSFSYAGRWNELPRIEVQFADYGEWQQSAHRLWTQKHAAYWERRLAGCGRMRFPDARAGRTTQGWGNVPFSIGKEIKRRLREWCRPRRTTLVMSVFSAYVALVMRWCDVSDGVVLYRSDGRMRPEVQNTIGFFASTLHLRVELRQNDTFTDFLNRVTREYCNASDHFDASYVETPLPRPAFTANASFNWVPKGASVNLRSAAGSGGGLICSAVPFVNPILDSLDSDLEPQVLLHDSDDDVAGSVHFPLSRFSPETMHRFSRNFLWFLGALLARPEARIMDIELL